MKLKLKPLPKDGDTREKTKFLWLPKEINQEIRWLEYARWQERYYYSWEPIKWINQKR